MSIAESHSEFDAGFAKVRELSAAAGHTITCTKGCFGCCKEPVLATREEIRYALEMLSPEERAGVAERTRRWLIQARASGYLEEVEPHVFLWRMANLWCPLLKDGLCQVYDRRPISCRAHSATGDPAACHDEKERLEQTYVTCSELTAVAVGYEIEASGQAEMSHLGLWLTELLLGQKIESAATFRITGRVEGETLHLDLSDFPSSGRRPSPPQRKIASFEATEIAPRADPAAAIKPEHCSGFPEKWCSEILRVGAKPNGASDL